MPFYNEIFLKEQCKQILSFYDARVIDETGGYHQNFYDNGELFNRHLKQLVSSTRIVINYASVATLFNNPEYIAKAKHGLDYIETVHWRPEINGYSWTLNNHQPLNNTQFSYGYAFVLLAYAAAKKAGVIDSDEMILTVFDRINDLFWLEEHGLYADETKPSGELTSYRGQNTNMHLCEAFISAYEATQDKRFINRAATVAKNITFKQSDLTHGLIWEHYDENFAIDWEFNINDPKNLYRPWGFQPGHQTEWTKLLLQLNKHLPEKKWIIKAETLFNLSFEPAWDKEYGGLVYGLNPEYQWCDDDKYFWVQSESFAAAAMLYKETKNDSYLQKYNLLWEYCLEHFVDKKYGAWFRLLSRENVPYNNKKCVAGAKCDYHNLSSCIEVIKTLNEK